ncbi:hypothetical protein DSO57_1011868 [Entomophthora muscae]|uniref:Uncharacterized protein n=1 Tax=Entomophthora muscae TaxID=34485 RepID=A0ACC2S7Y2_9FUNG|nr:hypothetical protein DSO57_1011868 [Entomophthora muscae]
MGSSSWDALAHLKFNRSKTALTEVQWDNEEVADDEESIKGEVKTFYTTLYQHTKVDQLALTQLTDIALPALTKCSADESKDLIATISTKDIQLALKEASRGKAPGPDNIPAEVYCALQASLLPEMVRLFN